MRPTIGRKIALALSAVVSLGLLAMLLIYQGLGRVGEAMRDLADEKEPANAATYELEIQLHAIGLAVLRYLDTGDPGVRSQVSEGDAQFARFHDRYRRLVTTSEEQELARRIEREYAAFKEQAQALLAAKHTIEQAYTAIGRNFERMDEMLEAPLSSSFPSPASSPEGRAPEPLGLTGRILRVEAEVAEVGLWLANYHRVPSAEHRDLMFQKHRDVQEGLGRLRAAVSSPRHVAWVDDLERLFMDTTRIIEAVLADDLSLRQQAAQFIRTRDEIDSLLDDEIQVRAVRALWQPRQAADEAARAIRGRIPVLMLTFLALAIGVSLLLGRAVTKPVKLLAEGAARVGQGDLSHSIRTASRDELADLTHDFNRMVERLRATTVSKGRLEESEQRLTEVVAQLRQEIDVRSRAERERSQLEASLRRAETMSAMGTLVAGVAHEVRNPLFGISSVLDAMEARHGSEYDSRKYMVVLREQVDRLTRLMQELLEYGRPATPELAPGSVGDVIEDATQVSCSPRTDEVDVVCDVAPGLPPVLMDRARLARALANLIDNAVQHSPSGGVVGVEARPATLQGRPGIEVCVSDQGPGIAEPDLARIFEPFFTRRRGGTGLGLSIVQRTVEEHHGTLSAGNRPGGGAVVAVRLPATEPVGADSRVA